MPVSYETYKRVALEDDDFKWELVCGRLRRKRDMTTEHGQAGRTLAALIIRQVDRHEYSVGTDSGRLRTSAGSFYVPDVLVIPMAMARRLRERPGTFEVYADPVPFVAEVWSPSTGEYDVEDKLREYQGRKDREIWRVHPPRGGESKGSPPYQSDRTVTAWRLQPDGSYAETVHTSGTLELVALPGAVISLDDLFA